MPVLQLKDIFPDSSVAEVIFLELFLRYSSKTRITASMALEHDYFLMRPLQVHHSKIRFTNSHDLTANFDVDSDLELAMPVSFLFGQ